MLWACCRERESFVILPLRCTVFRYSDYSLATAAQQFGVAATLPSAAAIAAQAAAAANSPVVAAQAAAAQAAASTGAPGKARSSMSLQLLSGR